MEPFRIKTINRIAPEGLALFGPNFQVGPDEANPHGIVVRSSQVDTDDYPELLAVARAGAGVNNITVDKATEHGICVFNTPGANANAVAELLFTMLGNQMRHINEGVRFCKDLAGLDDAAISEAVELAQGRLPGCGTGRQDPWRHWRGKNRGYGCQWRGAETDERGRL